MEACLLYAGTEDGLVTLHLEGDDIHMRAHGLNGNAVRGIAVHPDDPATVYVACGLRGWGLHRTTDAGATFEKLGFADRWVWDVVFDPNDAGTLWVGTEPPMLYVTRDEGATFQDFPAIDELPSRPGWKFFHPPFHAGHIHGIALHPERPERLFAGVEHGSLVYTHDGGETWQETLLGHDLHRVAIDPADPGRVLAGDGSGLLISPDAGRTWDAVSDLHGKYVHAILFDPRSSERVYLYANSGASPLYRSDDSARSWRPIGAGLPTAAPADNICLHPTQPDTLFYAGDSASGGALFTSLDAGSTWHRMGVELPKVWRMRSALMP